MCQIWSSFGLRPRLLHHFHQDFSSLRRIAHLLREGDAGAAHVEKLGLVVRKSSPSDRRARVVELTAQGKRLAASCFERHAKDLEALMSALSQEEKEQLYESLKKLGLLAAEKLNHQEAKVNSSRKQVRK